MRSWCHLAVVACFSLTYVTADPMYDDDSDLYNDAAKTYLRFGRGNHYMRFGRAVDLTDDNVHVEGSEDEDDAFPRYRRQDPIIRIGRGDKPFLRFGRPDAIIRIGRSDPLIRIGRADADLESFDKRENKVYHVGKRADPLIRFGKRADPLIRFGKRRNGIIRIGRADPIIRFGRADPIIRFGKRDPFPRFEMKRDPFPGIVEKADIDGLEMPPSSTKYRMTRSADQSASRKKRSASPPSHAATDQSDVTKEVVQRSWPPIKKNDDGQSGYMRFGRADFMRFGRTPGAALPDVNLNDGLWDLLQKMYVSRTRDHQRELDKKDGGYMRFGRGAL